MEPEAPEATNKHRSKHSNPQQATAANVINELLQLVIADLCLQECSQLNARISQLESISTHEVTLVEIANLQLLNKLYFVRQELQIRNQVMPPLEDKIRQLLEIVHEGFRSTRRIENIYEKE